MRETRETSVLPREAVRGISLARVLSFFLSVFINILSIELEISSIIAKSRQVNQYLGK